MTDSAPRTEEGYAQVQIVRNGWRAGLQKGIWGCCLTAGFV